ncbi:MAG: sigma-70 family RNA polymerase sigma factor [Clostridia bacterium]|nr:sigma-70 family RNA polymerase sigma factor [Clostridia bacterium]
MAEELDALFARYKETGDTAIRNQIAEKYLYIAEILAKKFVGRGVPYDDLYQEASYALLRAIDRFDISQGVQFSTFVTPTVTGELKNYFRDKTRMVKLPRRLSELSVAVKKYCDSYLAKNGAQPTVTEIATALQAEEEEVIKVLETGGTLSLDKVEENSEKGGSRSLLDAFPVGEEDFERIETRETLKEAMKDLSLPEKKLILYRYRDNLSQTETAKRLGVSQMFVSRTERKLMKLLKERLQEENV